MLVIVYGVSLHVQALPFSLHSLPVVPSQGQVFGMWKFLRFLWVSPPAALGPVDGALASLKTEGWHHSSPHTQASPQEAAECCAPRL